MTNEMERAKAIKDQLITWRRRIHQNPELGTDLPMTVEYVSGELGKMGLKAETICPGGVVALLEGRAGRGKTLLLRADMDALPMQEESDLPFKSRRDGVAHTCGHDTHTAMLLGAAKLLVEDRDALCGNVKFMFQPAEESPPGAMLMIKAGILENPKVDAAMALHCLPGDKYETGKMLYAPGPAKASADMFRINVEGVGTHGAKPNLGVDPINIMCHIQLALQTINSREMPPDAAFVLTVCQMVAGDASNILPPRGFMTGSIRAFDKNVRALAKQRMTEIAQGVATSLGGSAEVVFERGLGATINDKTVGDEMFSYVRELLGENKTGNIEPIMGSEDFSEVMDRVPGVYMDLSFGSAAEGYKYGVHHPLVTFNEEALPVGTAAFVHCAKRWLERNR
jgi:amidohydrolase